MSVSTSLVATVALLGGAAVGFALAVPGCCQCESPPIEFALGQYEITSVISTSDEPAPELEGAYTVTETSVVVQYQDADAVPWTVTYEVVCGDFLVAPCD